MSRFHRASKRRPKGHTFVQPVVTDLDVTSVAPANFVPTNTHQMQFEARDGTGDLVRIYEDDGTTLLAGRSVLFTSSDSGIASVHSTTGVVTAVAAGTAVITVRVEGLIQTSSYLVSSPVQTVTQVIITGPTTVEELQTITLTATPRDASNNAVLGQTVTWAEVSGAGDVTIGADSGTDPHTAQVTGVTDGSRLVKATCNTIDSSNYTITVTNPAAPGAYTAFIDQNWDSYAAKADIRDANGNFPLYVDGNFHNLMTPQLPASDFFDLVTVADRPDVDGVIGSGKVLRYLGGTNLNSYPLTVESIDVNPGPIYIKSVDNIVDVDRTITVQDHATTPTVVEVFEKVRRQDVLTVLNVGGLYTGGTPRGKSDNLPSTLLRAQANFNVYGSAIPPKASSFTALTGGGPSTKSTYTFPDNVPGRTGTFGQGFSIVGGNRLNVWFRTFLRFSTNWQSNAASGQHAASHKMIFFRYAAPHSGNRWEFIVDGPRGWWHSGNLSGTKVPSGWGNVISMNTQYNTSGWDLPDLYTDHQDSPGTYWKMFKAPAPPAAPNAAPTGNGTGEWYELIFHSKISQTGPPYRCEYMQAIRQYTVSGVAAPRAWRISPIWIDHTAFQPGGYQRLDMGVNRNRQWDESMYFEYTRWQAVDGAVYPNPWGFPVSA